MLFRHLPIQKKLMRMILLISAAILFVTCTSFLGYEYYSFKKSAIQNLSTLGQIISANSTAALAFDNHEDANEILTALTAEQHIVAAYLYDKDGNLFAQYPAGVPASTVLNTDLTGYRFNPNYLEGVQPVMKGKRQLGTLYLRSDLNAMYDRFKLYGIITAIIVAISFLLAFILSAVLQKSISKPILDLVQTARVISEDNDYSVRANKLGNDELGLLTDTFNRMLNEIQEQNQTLNKFNQNLEQKVLERTTELEALNRELDSFSYSISHDLRAPLRAINSYISIFREDYYNQVDSEGQRLIDIVLKNSVKMGVLIDDLLAFSKLGRKEVTKGDFSMKELVSGIWDDLSKMETGRDIEFFLDELPNATAERNLIHQVWVNLISNALKYSGNKEKTNIRISFENTPGEVVYYIKDNGAGFKMEYYDKLFGVFQRLHSNQEFVGTGVGLAIVQKIISKHEGRIWAEAEVDKGATFYFSLPVLNTVIVNHS